MPLGSFVPGKNLTFQVLNRNGIVGVFNDGRKQAQLVDNFLLLFQSFLKLFIDTGKLVHRLFLLVYIQKAYHQAADGRS